MPANRNSGSLPQSVDIKVATAPTLVCREHELQALEIGWDALCVNRTITENATLFRVLQPQHSSATVTPDITYKHVVGARYRQVFAEVPYLALSAMVVPITADGEVVLKVRDSGDWPLSYECVGGFLREQFTHRTIDDFVIERLQRELPEIHDFQLEYAGYYVLPSIAECMYVFVARLPQTAEDLRANIDSRSYIFLSEIDDAVGATIPLHHPTKLVLEALQNHQILPV